MPSVVIPTLSSGTQVKKIVVRSSHNVTPTDRSLQYEWMNLDWWCVFTWMFPDASFYDLSDVFEGLGVVLQAVVTQGDVVGQR